MNRSIGEVRLVFPAGAVVRYRNPAHDDIALDGLELFRERGSDAVSTGQDRNVLLEERFESLAVFLHDCEKDCLDNLYCYLFPSQLCHGYEVPTRGGERISLALNVMLAGIGLFYKLQVPPRHLHGDNRGNSRDAAIPEIFLCRRSPSAGVQAAQWTMRPGLVHQAGAMVSRQAMFARCRPDVITMARAVCRMGADGFSPGLSGVQNVGSH